MVANRGEHAAHLMVTAFGDGEIGGKVVKRL